MEQPNLQLESSAAALDDVSQAKAVEKFNKGEVDEDTLREVVGEMLAEKDRRGVVRDPFLWRAILLYNEKIGVVIKDEVKVKEFYEKIKPILLGILNEDGVEYKIKDMNKQGIGTSADEKFREMQRQRPDLYA